MQTYRNIHFTKRDYECSNIVACIADENPDPSRWEPAEDTILAGLSQLWIENNVRLFGYL